MARFDTYVRVPAHVAALMGCAAEETGASISRFASLACTAAARLAQLNPRTSAIPHARMPEPASAGLPYAEVAVSLDDATIRAISEAADRNSMSLAAQLRGILFAAVEGYSARAAEPRPQAPRSERVAADVIARVEAAKPVPKAMPTRKPFDPAYYARKAVMPVHAGPALSGAALTAAAFGDPVSGQRRAGRI